MTDFAGAWPTATSTAFDAIGGQWSHLAPELHRRSRGWIYVLLAAITLLAVIGFCVFLAVNANASAVGSCGGA